MNNEQVSALAGVQEPASEEPRWVWVPRFNDKVFDAICECFPRLMDLCSHAFSPLANIILLQRICEVAEELRYFDKDVEDRILEHFLQNEDIATFEDDPERRHVDWYSLEAAVPRILRRVLRSYKKEMAERPKDREHPSLADIVEALAAQHAN